MVKVGNSGVSIATVDDAKKLYSGFDLCIEDFREHDHQRTGADPAGLFHECRDRPAMVENNLREEVKTNSSNQNIRR